jgi:hypothetical protein
MCKTDSLYFQYAFMCETDSFMLFVRFQYQFYPDFGKNTKKEGENLKFFLCSRTFDKVS